MIFPIHQADQHSGYYMVGQTVRSDRHLFSDKKRFTSLMQIIKEELHLAKIKIIYYCGFRDQYILLVRTMDLQALTLAMESISRRFEADSDDSPLLPQILYHEICSSKMMYELIRDIYDDTEYKFKNWLPFGGGKELLEWDEGFIDREALELATGIPVAGWKEMLKHPSCFTTAPSLPQSYDKEAGYCRL